MAALLLAVVAILFFIPDVFEGNVLQQHDTVQGIANGQEGKAFTEATGQTTRWTDALFGGMPNFQISPSYPANDMLQWVQGLYTQWLPSPAGILFAMMLGFFIMGLCFGLRWPLALFGAIAWGFSSYFIIIIGAGHIWKFVTLAYIPPTIGAIALCYRGKYLYGTALAALFGAMQLQSNHPQMTYYFMFVIFFMVVAWLYAAIRDGKMAQWGKATLCVLGAGVLAVAANGSSLYNSYEYSKETVRGKSTEIVADAGNAEKAGNAGMDRDAITAWSYGVDETLTLLIPNVKGGATIKPEGGMNMPLSVLDTETGSSAYLSPEESQWIYQGGFYQYFGNQPMTNGPVYVGAIVLLLAVLAMFVVDEGKWVPIKWALFASLVVSIVLAWGDNCGPVTDFFIDYFPAYNKFRAVASMLVVAEFCIPFLAILCVMKMLETPDFLSRYQWTLISVTGVFLLICFAGAVYPAIFGSPFRADEMRFLSENSLMADPAYANVLRVISDSRLSLVRADSLRSLIYILIGCALCYLYMKGILKSKPLFVCALTAVVLIDLFNVDKRYVNHDNFVEPAMSQSQLDETDADRQILKDKGHYRVMDVDGFSSARSSYFHKTIGGYHAAKLTRYNDLIEHQIRKNNLAVLNMLNAKYFITGGKVVENPDALGNAWFVDTLSYVTGANREMRALDTLHPGTHAVADASFRDKLGQGVAKTAGDTVMLTSYAPNRIDYRSRSAKGGVAVFSEVYFPWGWEATVDGKPVEIGRVNYVLRALRLPAGEHEVVFRFDPKSIRVADNVGIASVSVIYLLCAAALVSLTLCVVSRRRVKEIADNIVKKD